MDRSKLRICTTCGNLGQPARTTPGSFLIELVLWLCMIIPGLIYSLWRVRGRHSVCAKCGGEQLVPIDTPAAKALIAQYHLEDEVKAAGAT